MTMTFPRNIPHASRLGLLAALAAAASLLGGCSSSSGPTKLEVAPSQYPAAFEAAKEALRHYRFPLERVDYVQGEISSASKYSSGLATPWDAEQSTIENEWEDYINAQSRSVRIRFETASQIAFGQAEPAGSQAAASPVPPSLEESKEPLFAQVIVTVRRVDRPGWQPQPKAARLSSFTEDPDLTARGMFPAYEVIISRDEKLAARIVERMKKTLAASSGQQAKAAKAEPPAENAPASEKTPEARPVEQPPVNAGA